MKKKKTNEKNCFKGFFNRIVKSYVLKDTEQSEVLMFILEIVLFSTGQNMYNFFYNQFG